MPEPIDRDALIETLKIMREKNKAEPDDSIETSLIVIGIQEAYCSAIEAVQEAPNIDAVPVVRCMDCIYWQPNNAEEGDYSGYCRNRAECENQLTDATFFCGSAERG